MESSLIYEDQDLLVLNKPSGLAVHGGSGIAMGLVEALRAMRNEPQLQLGHRLDRDTSGVVLLFRRHRPLTEFHSALRHGRVRKDYALLVSGDWPPACSKVDVPLSRWRSRAGERIICADDEGTPALSRFRVLKRYNLATRLLARPETGRTHQLRVHTAHIGCPILGDRRYGQAQANHEARCELRLKRLFLHAERLRVCIGNTELDFSAPLPRELEDCLGHLDPEQVEARRNV